MPLDIDHEICALQRLTVGQLRERYAAVFGETTRVGNKPWLVKRIAWRLQAQAEGDLSERARRSAAEPGQRCRPTPVAATNHEQIGRASCRERV